MIKLLLRYKIHIILFAASVAVAMLWNHRIFNAPLANDETIYNTIAQSLYEGKGFPSVGETGTIEPVYPLFVATIYTFFGENNIIAVKLFQIMLLAVIVVFLYELVRKISTERVARASAVLLLCFSGLATEAGKLHKEILFTLLLVTVIHFLMKCDFTRRARDIFFAAIFLGITIETNAALQFVPLFIIAALLFIRRNIPFYRRVILCLLVVAGACAIVLPFMISKKTSDGYTVAPRGGFILSLRAEYAANLYPQYGAHLIGHIFGYYLAQKIYPTVNSSTFRNFTATKEKYYNLLNSGIPLGEVDKILRNDAVRSILKAPQVYASSVIISFIDLNSPLLPLNSDLSSPVTIHPMFAEGRHQEMSLLQKTAIVLFLYGGWYVLLLLVLFGIYTTLRYDTNRSKFLWIIVFIVYFNLFFSLVHAIPRYSLPLYPFYVMFLVIGCSRLPDIFPRIYRKSCDLLSKIKYNRMPQ